MSDNAVKHDLNWIKQQLQAAVELECSTLPIYLSAMYSLEVQSNTAYTAIRVVVMEEMVHMAIAANILAALGGSPQIANIQFAFPVHGLPGGVEPDLYVGLAQLSRRQLKNFLRIEMPDFLLRQVNRKGAYRTIADFYQEIRKAITENAADIRAAVTAGGPANQVADNIGFRAINKTTDPLPQILAGLDEIMEQGEGASCGSMFAGDGSEDEASHYNRFAELYYGASYQAPVPSVELTPATEASFFKGRKIPFPTVINTLAVPSDGYAKILQLDPNAAAATTDLKAFDTAYSSILTALHAVWNGPQAASWKTLGGAVHTMVDLRVLSCFNILRHQIPADVVSKLADLYGPEFERLNDYSDLKAPCFYGPRFQNTNATP